MEAKLRAKRKEIEDVKRDLDINMSDFLQTEAVGKEKATTFLLTFKHVSAAGLPRLRSLKQ